MGGGEVVHRVRTKGGGGGRFAAGAAPPAARTDVLCFSPTCPTHPSPTAPPRPAACAMACAQLEGMVGALAENVAEERAAACAMMTELLDRILTKVGGPMCWWVCGHGCAGGWRDDSAPGPHSGQGGQA